MARGSSNFVFSLPQLTLKVAGPFEQPHGSLIQDTDLLSGGFDLRLETVTTVGQPGVFVRETLNLLLQAQTSLPAPLIPEVSIGHGDLTEQTLMFDRFNKVEQDAGSREFLEKGGQSRPFDPGSRR